MANRILLVEDSDDIALVAETALTMRHYNVTRAKDGATGLKLAQSDTWDLVILDVLLPEIDGFVVLERLKSDPKTHNTKVALFTAHITDKEQQLAAELGADGILEKPFHPHEFVKAIGAIISRA